MSRALSRVGSMRLLGSIPTIFETITHTGLLLAFWPRTPFYAGIASMTLAGERVGIILVTVNPASDKSA
jgi:hypothetical protein